MTRSPKAVYINECEKILEHENEMHFTITD